MVSRVRIPSSPPQYLYFSLKISVLRPDRFIRTHIPPHLFFWIALFFLELGWTCPSTTDGFCPRLRLRLFFTPETRCAQTVMTVGVDGTAQNALRPNTLLD